ncbi:MAG TPA: DUF255 domain-containing protein [Candidatus Dormibacteraeota bacterium]|nr:DUF255 domain-containing protein [Candidatus Dormibacteraeota bacterium]
MSGSEHDGENGGGFHFSPRPNRAHEIRWQPWSPEAFERARAEDRPILLAISAVWCHWCHVMDETTYSDQRVIDLVNREYVPIRVDNDVRPDVNQRYNMGGWPTTAFLTPEGDILTGGTYLPPDQMVSALTRVTSYFRTHRPEIAARVLEGRRQAAAVVAAGAGELEAGLVDRILGTIQGAYDPEHGGFGTAPKFPHPEALALLAEQSVLRREPELMEMARHSLSRMATGGMYDHVEGGFFRYSTTQDWSVPHYEKMLEDHAGLIGALAATGQGEILDDAVRYLDGTLRDPDSGLYAGSQDADEEYYRQDAAGRAGRRPPYVDRRVYAGWNCALAVAYLEADLRLGRPRLREEAGQLLERLFERLFDPERGLGHTDQVGGQLGDQVWGLRAATSALAAGLGTAWRTRALQLAELLERAYGDPELGGYFDRAEGAEGEELGRLRERIKPLPENAVAAIGLMELDALLGDPELGLRDRARRALASVAGLARRHGILAAGLARALDRALREPVRITTGDLELARAALAVHPYAVIERAEGGPAVICVGTTCQPPTDDPEQVARTVERAAGLR